jgi:hypothetical protein
MRYLSFLLICICLCSCNSIQKEIFISKLESFVLDVESNYKKYNEEDWNDTDLKYREFMDNQYEHYQPYFTQVENNHVNALMGKYQALKIKAGIIKVKNKIKDKLDQIITTVDEIATDTTLFK